MIPVQTVLQSQSKYGKVSIDTISYGAVKHWAHQWKVTTNWSLIGIEHKLWSQNIILGKCVITKWSPVRERT